MDPKPGELSILGRNKLSSHVPEKTNKWMPFECCETFEIHRVFSFFGRFFGSHWFHLPRSRGGESLVWLCSAWGGTRTLDRTGMMGWWKTWSPLDSQLQLLIVWAPKKAGMLLGCYCRGLIVHQAAGVKFQDAAKDPAFKFSDSKFHTVLQGSKVSGYMVPQFQGPLVSTFQDSKVRIQVPRFQFCDLNFRWFQGFETP